MISLDSSGDQECLRCISCHSHKSCCSLYQIDRLTNGGHVYYWILIIFQKIQTCPTVSHAFFITSFCQWQHHGDRRRRSRAKTCISVNIKEADESRLVRRIMIVEIDEENSSVTYRHNLFTFRIQASAAALGASPLLCPVLNGTPWHFQCQV